MSNLNRRQLCDPMTPQSWADAAVTGHRVTWTVSDPDTADQAGASSAVSGTRRLSQARAVAVVAGSPHMPWREATDLSAGRSIHVGGVRIAGEMDDEPRPQALLRGVGHSKPKRVVA
jgi:hypothetical protein